MYRRTRKYQEQITRSAKAKARREIAREEGHHPDYPPELPELRRVILITDYDTGTPITHKIELYRTTRIDCYNAWVNGRLWKKRIGWSRVLEGLRKALPRLQNFD
jgi:hypothetical protein